MFYNLKEKYPDDADGFQALLIDIDFSLIKTYAR